MGYTVLPKGNREILDRFSEHRACPLPGIFLHGLIRPHCGLAFDECMYVA